jgi:Na+-transporting NADH:ubiquinone oxidoreductase subunit NqrB
MNAALIRTKSRMDSWLGRFTMYRLILWVLAILAAYSMVLEMLGWLTFGLSEMIAHLAVCLGLTYGANRLLATLFQIKPHSESSLITGLLLYFLFWPSLAVLDLAGIALACVLASASKYALAFRGRHIFNPAAAGAFITSFTGLNVATWWAATPAMLWLLVPGVFLIVYRTRKVLMAGTFLLVATSIICVELLRVGMTFDSALWQALAQRPLLFFVGFMLTEPLTLPPRRWGCLCGAVLPRLRREFPRTGAAPGQRLGLPGRTARRGCPEAARLPSAIPRRDGVPLCAGPAPPLLPRAVRGTQSPARAQ